MELQKNEEVSFSISTINEYLLTKGFELTEEEIDDLQRYQKEVLNHLECLEFDDNKLFSIIMPYTLSPYLSYANKLGVLKASILIYYKIRMEFDWHLDDEDLVKICYKEYIEHFGVLEKDLIQSIIQNLKKEGYSNRDNINGE